LDCDWQSKIKIGFWIWIVNPVFEFQSKSKNKHISYQETKKLMINLATAIKPSNFLSTFV
jgi:hypothetical protein